MSKFDTDQLKTRSTDPTGVVAILPVALALAAAFGLAALALGGITSTLFAPQPDVTGVMPLPEAHP